MPGWTSYALAHEIENFIYRGQAITIGATLYMRLLVSPSSRAGGGTETNYAGYARKPFARDTSSIWTVAPSNGLLVNGVRFAFGVATSLGNGDLVWFDFVDTSSGAFTKLYNGGPILPAVALVINKSPEFDIGKLQITY
jgi:hypothetical protein